MNLLITGISGRLGQEVVRQLIHENPFDQVIGIDQKPPSILGPVTQFLPGDLRKMPIGDLMVFNEIQCVLHLSGMGDSDVKTEAEIAERIIQKAALIDVERVVIPSRDWVYAPRDQPCDESAPLRLSSKTRTRMGWSPIESKILLEQSVAEAMVRWPNTNVVIPRMCTVIGPNRDQSVERVLTSPWILGLSHKEARLQFLDLEDAARMLIMFCLKPGLEGPYNVASEGILTLSNVAGILEKPLVKLPKVLLRLTVDGRGRIGFTACGFGDLVRLHGGMPMQTKRMREHIGTPRLSSRQALALWRVNG